jgi:hypothetical protein
MAYRATTFTSQTIAPREEAGRLSGIPGVVFYQIFLGSIFATFKETRKLSAESLAPQSDLIRSIALNVEAALVYVCVCAMFMTGDKHPHQFVLAGFAVAMVGMARALPVKAPAAAPATRRPNAAAPYAGPRPRPVAAW